MTYLTCVMRGQLDPVFSFDSKMDIKASKTSKKNTTCTDTEMQFQWARHNILQ